jgi:hypothetical protein
MWGGPGLEGAFGQLDLVDAGSLGWIAECLLTGILHNIHYAKCRNGPAGTFRWLWLALVQALDRLLLPLSDTQQGRDCSMTESGASVWPMKTLVVSWIRTTA